MNNHFPLRKVLFNALPRSQKHLVRDIEALNNGIRHAIELGKLVLYYNPLKHYIKFYMCFDLSQWCLILVEGYIEILDQYNNEYFHNYFILEDPLLEKQEEESDDSIDDYFSIFSGDEFYYHNIETTYDK